MCTRSSKPTLTHRFKAGELWRVLFIFFGTERVLVQNASAVFTVDNNFYAQRSIRMTVGSTGATINTVTFNVTGANISPNPIPVVGVTNAPATSPPGGVTISLRARRVNPGGNTVNLTVDSSPGMACQTPATCGATNIPFNTVSWVSHNHLSETESQHLIFKMAHSTVQPTSSWPHSQGLP